MKFFKYSLFAGMGAALLLFTMAQTNFVSLGTGTQMRVPVTTTAFMRGLLATNESAGSLLIALNIPPGITNFVISTIAPAGQYVQVGNSTNLVGTFNGNGWTNLQGASIVGGLTNNTSGTSALSTNVAPGISITNEFGYFTNSSTGEWGYRDTNGFFLRTNAQSGVWFFMGPTNFYAGVGLSTNISMNAQNGQIVSSNIVASLTAGTATNASATGTAAATNDTRSLVLTNAANQFAGTFTGAVSGFFSGNIFGSTNLVGNINTFSNNSTYAETNLAPISHIVNPLNSGASYTTPNSQGTIVVNVLTTNTGFSECWLTNLTTAACQYLGGYGTNYYSAMFTTGPNDVVMITNQSGTVVLRFSEWRQ